MLEIYPIIMLIASVTCLGFAFWAKSKKDKGSFRRNAIVGYIAFIAWFSFQIEGPISLAIAAILFIGFFLMCLSFVREEKKENIIDESNVR